MKFIKPFATAALSAGLAIQAFAAASLTNLVNEKAPAYVVIDDVPALIKQWQQSPWALTWNDDQVKKFFAPMRANMKIDEWDETCRAETGHTVQEILAFATGDALIALTDLDFARSGETPDSVPIILAVEVGKNTAALEKMISDAREKEKKKELPITYSEENFAGYTINIETTTKGTKTSDIFWSIADGVFFFSGSKQTLQVALDGLKKGGIDNALGKSEVFVRAKKLSGNANFMFSANFREIMPVVQQAVADKAAKNENPNPMVNPSAMITALGLDALNDVVLGISMSDTATNVSGALTYSEQRGLLKMLAYHDGPAARPSWVPAKTITVNSSKFSIRDAYSALEEMVGSYNPMVLGMAQMQIQNFNQQLGIDIKRDFFGSIGDEIISGNLPRPGVPADKLDAETVDSYFVVSLDNPKAFTTAIEALRNLMGEQADKMLPKREYLGTTVYSYVVPNFDPKVEAKTISYAVAKNQLVVGVGSKSAIESILQSLGGAQPSMWDRPEVKRALADVPTKASSFSYQDSRLVIGIIFETLTKIPGQAKAPKRKGAAAVNQAAPVANDSGRLVDPDAKPDAATIGKYWSDAFGYGEHDANGIYFKSTLNHKK